MARKRTCIKTFKTFLLTSLRSYKCGSMYSCSTAFVPSLNHDYYTKLFKRQSRAPIHTMVTDVYIKLNVKFDSPHNLTGRSASL